MILLDADSHLYGFHLWDEVRPRLTGSPLFATPGGTDLGREITGELNGRATVENVKNWEPDPNRWPYQQAGKRWRHDVFVRADTGQEGWINSNDLLPWDAPPKKDLPDTRLSFVTAAVDRARATGNRVVLPHPMALTGPIVTGEEEIPTHPVTGQMAPFHAPPLSPDHPAVAAYLVGISAGLSDSALRLGLRRIWWDEATWTWRDTPAEYVEPPKKEVS